MKIKLINLGSPNKHYPIRQHDNDAGADVFMPFDTFIKPGQTLTVPLGYGVAIPDGYAGYIFPRSSMATKGLVCQLPPIDSGYRGEIHAIISNITTSEQFLKRNTRIGQLVIIPVVITEFVSSFEAPRENKAFGSTGQ